MKPGRVRIGISGWRYAGWRGVFYPPKFPQRRELEFAASRFSTVEINGTFYSLQKPQYFRDWSAQTPEDFVFGVKGSRYLTHMLKLRNAEKPLANFFASGLLELGKKLGPILWQFPPQLRFERTRFHEFFAKLPRTHAAAAVLAREHDQRLDNRATTEVAAGVPGKTLIRHAIEIRDESFATEEFIAVTARARCGACGGGYCFVAAAVRRDCGFRVLSGCMARRSCTRAVTRRMLWRSGRIVSPHGPPGRPRRDAEHARKRRGLVRGMCMCTSTTMQRFARHSMRWGWRRRWANG